MPSMKIVVTGTSGFIGRHVLPELEAAGAELLLVGREPERLAALFGDDVRTCGYGELAEQAKGFDTLLHLAALIRGESGDGEAYRAANVTFLETVLGAAREAGIGHVINITSLDARADSPDPYFASKGEADALLRARGDMQVTSLRVAAVYGERFMRTLSVLERLPKSWRKPALNVLACARPVTHVSRVAEAVLRHAREGSREGGSSFHEEYVTDGQHDNPVYGWIMRLVDLLFVAMVLGFLWWLLLIVWAAVRLTSPGPGLFLQERVGQHRESFTLYKFRTMAKDTVQRGTHEVSASSVTRIGAVLRKTKLDEFPQAVNILFNQLSLVGPRPCLPSQTELIDLREKRGVFAIKGGITGLAASQGIVMDDPERLAEVDAEYIARRTVLFDLGIILRTFLGSGQGDRVAK